MPTGGSTDLQTALKVATNRDRIAEDERLQLAAPLKGGAQHLQHPVLGIGRGREVRGLRHQRVSSGPMHSTERIFLIDKFILCIAPAFVLSCPADSGVFGGHAGEAGTI